MSEWRQNGATSAKSQGGDQRSHRIEAHREMILSVIKVKPDMTLVQIAEMLEAETGASFAPSSVWRFLDRHAITFKKTAHAAEQDRPDVAAAREAWRELAPRLDPDKLVFIDETGCPYRKSNPGILMMETAEDRAAIFRARSAPRGTGASLFNDQ